MAPHKLAMQGPAKAPAAILLDSAVATYLPPILCATCEKAQLSEILRPLGFTVEEFQTAAARVQELTWDFKTLCESSDRCRLCRMMLECIKECEEYDASRDADVVVSLEPVGEFQEMGDLTWWMIFTRQTPRPTMGESIRCQLRVGLRLTQGEETPGGTTISESLSRSNSSTFPLVPHPERSLDAVPQLHLSASHPRDHPPHNRIKAGFVASNASHTISYSRERELSQANLTKLARLEVFKPFFDNIRASVDSFFDSVSNEMENSSTQALRPVQNRPETPERTMIESVKFSSLSIRRLGREPNGPVDRQCISIMFWFKTDISHLGDSWRYEVENIMTARKLSISQADLKLASYWLFVCRLWHKHLCSPLVWTAGCSGACALRVIDMKRQCITTAPPRCKYAALSYTWGTAKQYKLMKATYDNMCRPGWLRKATDQLPRTIIDAVLVCRGLDIRYLWVDALCIIQDSPEDKDTQIGSMAFVYGGAFLTIVAGTGNSADAGLRGVSLPRKHGHFQSEIGKLKVTTASASGIDSLLKSAWYTRGWTFQELVLSKRILAFTEEQMMFFCVRAFFQEDMVMENVNGMFSRSQNQKELFDRHISVSRHDFTSVAGRANCVRRNREGGDLDDYRRFIDINQALEDYWIFLTSYLRRNLSYDGDILNAFAGILDALSPLLGTFRWGIPVLYPDIMLTWNFPFAHPVQRRAGFPSWSWTGWTGYAGELQFHKSPLYYFSDYELQRQHQPLFYSCLENRRIILFGQLHHRNSQDYSQDWKFTDREWAQIRHDPSQYLLLITRTAFLTVDIETYPKEDPTLPPDLRRYSVYLGLFRVGHIYLKPSWRSKQPAELEFVSIAKSQYGESLMLIQRRGSVAYRIQMVNKPIWPGIDRSKRRAIILG
jgi:hypothetical protein